MAKSLKKQVNDIENVCDQNFKPVNQYTVTYQFFIQVTPFVFNHFNWIMEKWRNNIINTPVGKINRFGKMSFANFNECLNKLIITKSVM